ncbi:MAG: sialidase family protein [Candidatus Latescibacterota bacterium]
MNALSFSYEDGAPIAAGSRLHTQTAAIKPVRGTVHLYLDLAGVERNPAPLLEGKPAAMQTLELGCRTPGGFTPAVRLGLASDNHTGMGEFAYLLPWLHDGRFDYYGMFVRPRTPYRLRLTLDLAQGRLTAWVSGAGDDDWFLLADGASLIEPAATLDEVRVQQHQGATAMTLVMSDRSWAEGEQILPHPLAKADRVVEDGRGFRFQSMRSLWCSPGRHVTIARNNPDTTPEDRAWLGFPDVVRTGPTHLVCSHGTGAAHGGGGDCVVRHSDDLGRTWGEPVEVHEGGVNSPRLQRLEDGGLLALCDVYGDNYPVCIYRSDDGGYAWESLGKLRAADAGGHGGCVPSHVAELPDGSWLLATSWVAGNPWTLEDGEQIEIYRSVDQGKTWILHSIVKERPYSLSEASFVPMPGGRIWLFVREAHGLLPGVKTFSDDGGRTWARLREMPFPMVGRTDVRMRPDGRVFSTCRSQVGRPALWAWTGAVEEETGMGIMGAHFNDRHSVGLKDGALHLDNDGYRGQFTQYFLRGPDGPDGHLEVIAEVQVVSNLGGAATLSIPYVGRLRLFPDRVVLAHEPSLAVAVQPGRSHTYCLQAQAGHATLLIDGEQAFETDKADPRVTRTAWSPVLSSPYVFAFGNEPVSLSQWNLTPERVGVGLADWEVAPEQHLTGLDGLEAIPPMLMLGMGVAAEQVTPRVTGYSIWRRVEVRMHDPVSGERRQSWEARLDGFPDQYQLDRVLEVDASIRGWDQGYSGWTELDDGRLFVVNYTDDTAPACRRTSDWPSGLPWIRGTWIEPGDLA